MRLLFLFLDGVGLGVDNPEINPFRRAAMPTMELLLEGKSLVASSAPYMGSRASLLALDACLGVAGVPNLPPVKPPFLPGGMFLQPSATIMDQNPTRRLHII